MDSETVAQFGQLHPEIAARRKLRQDVFIAELYLDVLYKRGLRRLVYRPLPKYPAIERDFSFIFADSVIFEQIRRAVSSLGLNELRSFAPVEIFRGGSVPAAKYSILLRATFQSDDRTLRDEEVAEWSSLIIKALEALGGTLRAQ
jgi:phenylalanyl-tRNA synthetase beta chain